MNIKLFVEKLNSTDSQFEDLFKAVVYKGLISPRGHKKLKFIKLDSLISFDGKNISAGQYIVRYNEDEFKVHSELEFKKLDSSPEILIKKYMWSEEKETVDGIISYKDRIVLIYRKFAPIGWAMPGGIIDPGENAKTAFIREMKEELNIDISDCSLFKVESAIEPRGPIKTHVFVAVSNKLPVAGDDAAQIKLVSLSDLNEIDFAFAHHFDILNMFAKSKND